MTVFECKECEREFNTKDALDMHNNSKHYKAPKMSINKKKTRNWIIFIVIVGVVVFGIYFGFSNVETLPPTSMSGHIEANPSSHILREPMALAVQKHMLEHVDGEQGVRGGVIINYNCEDYECDNSLIDNLEILAKDYDYVYVAPFKNMDAKIALTKLGKIQVMEEYNEEEIKNFIVF